MTTTSDEFAQYGWPTTILAWVIVVLLSPLILLAVLIAPYTGKRHG